MSQMPGLLERDRIRFGFTVGQAAYRLGLTPAQYRALLEDPSLMTLDTWDRVAELYGWPRSFARTATGAKGGAISATWSRRQRRNRRWIGVGGEGLEPPTFSL